jgi:hypothetical protein
MSENLTPRAPSLEEIFAEIGGQPNSCTHEEYYAFARLVRKLAPCALLVFGVGRDSIAWRAVNEGGRTLFLENNGKWIEKIGTEIGKEYIRALAYQQVYEEWEATGFSPEAVPLPELEHAPFFDHRWDCIFVDAPWGPTFGRHQSTHAATAAVKPGGLIALHDCERERELTVCRVLLQARGFELIEEVERLRIYRAP